jgi:hypothetical protein
MNIKADMAKATAIKGTLPFSSKFETLLFQFIFSSDSQFSDFGWPVN